MLQTPVIISTLAKLAPGHQMSEGFTDAHFGKLEKLATSLGEVASQHVEIEAAHVQFPPFINMRDFKAREPNFHSNELVAVKIAKHLENHGLSTFFSPENYATVMNNLTSHDIGAVAKLYGCQTYSQAIDTMLPSFYDIVFVVEDGANMNTHYVAECVRIMSNAMFSTLMYDSTGIYIRTLNKNAGANELKTVAEIEAFMNSLHKVSPSKSLGEEMYDKVYETVVKPTVEELLKPVLLVVLSNSVPTAKDEVLESLQRCRDESDRKMFLTFVNVTGTSEVNGYYTELRGNSNVTLVENITNIGQLVK